MEFFIGALSILVGATLFAGIKIVPQSQKFVVERFGRFQALLTPGIQFIWPFIDRVAHKIDILERRLPEHSADVITKDNVVVKVMTSTFFRVRDPERTVYRIADINGALQTAITGVVRSQVGLSEFDEVQSNRTVLNKNLIDAMKEIADDWGVEITRCEIIDVEVDAATREAMQKQINAERERRAAVTRAEGEKRAAELAADAEFYTAQKLADARRITADAEAYATETIAKAIAQNGERAIQFEVVKRQVDAMAKLSSSDNAKVIVVPSDLADAFGAATKLFSATRS